MIGQTCFTLRQSFFSQHGFKKHVLSTLAVNKPTKRNVKTMRKENSASWVDLFYRLAPFLTPQNTLKYIRYWFWRFWSTFQFTVRSSQKSITGKIINFGKIYQTFTPALRINDNWTKRGLLCCTLPIILFQWLGNLRAIYCWGLVKLAWLFNERTKTLFFLCRQQFILQKLLTTTLLLN